MIGDGCALPFLWKPASNQVSDCLILHLVAPLSRAAVVRVSRPEWIHLLSVTDLGVSGIESLFQSHSSCASA
jgi:hypothetical protein